MHAWLARLALSVGIAAVSVSGSVFAQTHSNNSSSSKPKSLHQASAAKAVPDPGEEKFRANCGRCHTTPEQLSPRITGTIVMHMRVRASLSEQDAQDILRYLSP
ncbi:hypothetical protein GCM10011507_04940 [Edaphobacter acidisoli]|uniref:Cytochrome c domain-containing protein n=2 Tax=Edaphobacter acidisoli TaxID=2040573 RepID=A0A916RGA7_9BACT|nr:hypothetical protein GCM10011507_04940 [Edaphobacter acidisoli]